MKIAFLVSRLDKPSTKFRIIAYLPLLRESGIKTEVFTRSKKTIEQWRTFSKLSTYDLVVIQKKLFSFMALAYIRRQSRKLIYDFDDAVMFKNGEKMDMVKPFRQKRFDRTIRFCDHIIAGNTYLKEGARLVSDRISVIPTPVDTDKYIPGGKAVNKKGITIGWLGSKSTIRYLKTLTPVFSELQSRFPDVQISVVSDRFEGIEEITAIKKIWREDEELCDLQSFDIGIMPLPDDPWTKGKCGFKLLQYQAVGLPVVCSPVGVNREMIVDGVNGFHANTHQEWFDRLNQLISSSELRNRMGKTGREMVAKKYSLKALWPKFLMTINNVLNVST
jgi:glycosyltransferase involved in cell wall biosynthesis